MINNKNFFSNVTFEYDRSGISYYTEDLDEAFELMSQGWKNTVIKGFRLTPLEESIVDITDYNNAMQYGNLELNLLYFDFIKDMYEKNKLNNYINEILNKKQLEYKGFQYFISYGRVLDTEVRISGSDMRIKNLKKDMLEEFINQNKDQISLKNKKYKILEQKIVNLSERSEKEINFFKETERRIKCIKDVNVYNEKIYKIYNWKLIEQMNFDVFLFVPFGCFKYLSSFVNNNNIDKIMFWELHGERFKESTFKLFSKDLKNKKVLILDKIYSGKTINLIKQKVEQCGGKPFVLGINPRNKENILQTDFVVILNNIFKSKDLISNDKNLFKNIYKTILYGGD